MSSEPPSGSQGEWHEMPASVGLSDQLCCDSSKRKLLSEVCSGVLKDLTEEITEMETQI